MSVRYYVYISDAKVDMLLSQIDPAAKRKLASEFSVGLKVFGAKRSSERVEGEDRISRLEAVTTYLRDYGDVGSVDEPGQFFWGLLPMRWGPYGDPFVPAPPLVYFGGATERTIVGLGGSTYNMMGSWPVENPTFSHSATPALLHALSSEPELRSELALLGTRLVDSDRKALAAVHLANANLAGPLTNLEFMAKRLLHGPSPYPQRDPYDGMSVVLGSPLYVAMAD